jgi:hypothetical protein
MKTTALILMIAIFSTAGVAAKTLTNPPGNANEQSVNGVAGPPPHAAPAGNKGTSRHPSRATLKMTKIKSPPPMHDPN